MSSDDTMRLLYLGLLLAALLGWGMVEYRKRPGRTLRGLMAWGMIFLGLAAGYGLWQDLRRDIRPDQVAGTNSISVPRAQDGHYYLRLHINGQPVLFMVDTGASQIVLSPADARSLGIDPDSLRFLSQAETANGTVRTARIALPEVTLGPFTDHDVTAYVNESDMPGSLLGMSYLGRFSISLEGDQMLLTR